MFEDSKIYPCVKDHLPAHCPDLISHMPSPEQNPQNPRAHHIKYDSYGRRWVDVDWIFRNDTKKVLDGISFIPEEPTVYRRKNPNGQGPHATKLQRTSQRQFYFRLD